MAAAGGGAKGGLGWAILAAALAVPGFLFYNWWSHLKAEHDRGVSSKARGRVPEGGVFQTPPANRLVNPMAASTATAPGAPVPPAGAAVATPAKPGMTPPAAAASTPAPAPAAALTAPPPGAVPVANSAAPVPAGDAAPAPGAADPSVATSSGTYVLPRDPMMSPMDLVRIREKELEAIRAEEERQRQLAERNRPTQKVKRSKPKEKPIDTHVDLQGIVATPDGVTLAIVNGATVNPGETFTVEGYSAPVKVVRITATEVTFEYKGKRFKKGVNAE